MQTLKKRPAKFSTILRKVYSGPASVISITGHWKEGKTDLALFLAETLQDMKKITLVGSNVHTDRFHFTQSMTGLKYWAELNKSVHKLFIYDEVVESTPRRRAMTALNVAWVKFIPQMSKLRLHVLVVTQSEHLQDSIFLDPTFNRGLWRKWIGRGKIHSASFNSVHHKIYDYQISKIPRTTVEFDPYEIASFRLSGENIAFDMLPRTFQVVELYAKNMSFRQISKELNLSHDSTVKRELHKACRVLLASLHKPSEGKRLIDLSEQID